jgi:hypothetical protein
MASQSEVESSHNSSETTNVTVSRWDDVSKNAALNVVANHLEGSEIKALREENLRLEKNLSALQNQTGVHMEWYYNLVRAARGYESHQQKINKYEGAERERMKKELEKLSSESGDWQHGFNSGMLAASRLYSAFAHAGTERFDSGFDDEDEEGEGIDPDRDRMFALQEFPVLDT